LPCAGERSAPYGCPYCSSSKPAKGARIVRLFVTF
jgi:hypothetical protein